VSGPHSTPTLGFFSFSPLAQHGLFCDCNNVKTVTTKAKACTVFANYFHVCHYKKQLQVIWYKLQKKPEQCVFATVLRA
jgi:hypothetical protein